MTTNNIPTGTTSWSCSQTGPIPPLPEPATGSSSSSSTARAGSLDRLLGDLLGLGTGADLAFIVYAMQIDQLNKATSDSLRSVEQTGQLRDAMSKHLSKLRELQAYVNKHADDNGNANYGEMVAEFAQRNNYGTMTWKDNHDDAKWKQAEQAFWTTYPMNKTSFSLDPNGAVAVEKKGGLGKDAGKVGWIINKEDLKAEIDNIGDEIKQLDSDREIKMIMLNQLINRKGNAVSQLSAILKSAHESEQSVINKLA